MRYRQPRKPSASAIRARDEKRAGWAMLILSLAAFVGMVWGAIEIDSARGMTVGESLASVGL